MAGHGIRLYSSVVTVVSCVYCHTTRLVTHSQPVATHCLVHTCTVTRVVVVRRSPTTLPVGRRDHEVEVTDRTGATAHPVTVRHGRVSLSSSVLRRLTTGDTSHALPQLGQLERRDRSNRDLLPGVGVSGPTCRCRVQ